MLGFYNTNSNNMYMNQNYGYGQSVMNPYQQQSSLFGGYSNGYSNYQQPSYDANSMLFSMLNSLLPLMLGQFSNRQPVQSPFATTIPATNTISNSITGNSGQNNILNSIFGNLFNNSASVATTVAPVVPATSAISNVIADNSGQNNIFNTIINILLNSPITTATTEKTPVEIYQEDIIVESSATGDPHFAINGQQSFDFQGKNEGLYKMLDNSDIALNAKFTGGGEGAATIINSQNLEFKKAGINLVSHADGKFEILQNGEELGDETNYNTDETVIKLLKDNDISISKEGIALTTTYGKRSLTQNLNGGNIDNVKDVLMKGDTGLLSQTVGAIDDDKDGKTQMKIDINKDGKVDEKDTMNYSIKDQFMVHTKCEGNSSAPITPEIEAAIKKDIEAGIKEGSAVKGFSAEHGYDARQWNEYLGAKLYTLKEDELLTAK